MAEFLVSRLRNQLVETEDASLAGILDEIVPFIENAERRQITDESVRKWLSDLRGTIHNMEDVLGQRNTAIPKQELGFSNKVPFSLHCSCFSFSQPSRLGQRLWIISNWARDLGLNVHYLNEQPGSPPSGRSFDSHRYYDHNTIYGRDREAKLLINTLLSESSAQRSRLGVIPIVGMGGVGKTTLVQVVFNCFEVRTHFDLRIWVGVEAPFKARWIARRIMANRQGIHTHVPDLLDQLHDYVLGRKFVLVLDDVRNEDSSEWKLLAQSLSYGAEGSRILVTTRNEAVASFLGTTDMLTLGVLSEEDCWLIFSRNTGVRTQREEIGRRIVNKCNGLPLAAAVLGSVMCSKPSLYDWEFVFCSELWELKAVEEGIFAKFMVSYYDLSPPLRCCFLYCAVLPKDYVIDRGHLIKLWMSQGYLDSDRNQEKESLGQEYFMHLATRSFFQDFEKDYKGSIIRCKMHGLIHDLAKFLTQNECFITEFDGDAQHVVPQMKKVRHCTLVLPPGAILSNSSQNGKALSTLCHSSPTVLRTLFLSCSTNTRMNPDAFLHLTCLRTLNLSRCWFKELPNEIGEFIHLRFLNLSGNDELERLPKTLCDLHNLQSLLINDCIRLQRLPEEIGNLVNLRHLLIDWSFNIERLPKGIAKLTSLHTLDMLVVPHHDDREAFQLEDLESLNNLEGYLRIYRCGNLENITDAGKAGLMNRTHLVNLNLDFDCSEERMLEDNIILEALLPHPGLVSLEIRKYRGITISPDWVMCLTNLRSLVLYSCQYCENLPPLGKLPFLESLDICLMKSVENVGLDFLGIDTDVAENSCSILFPKLIELRFSSLGKWKVWEGRHDNCTVMPCLHSLEIHSCCHIQVLPDFLKWTPVQNLTIKKCKLLQEHCREGTGKEWAKIAHIPYIKTDLENTERDDIPVLKDIGEIGEVFEDLLGTSHEALYKGDQQSHPGLILH